MQITGETGVTVIGPSYPPVISERGRHWAGISLANYRAAPSADAFMKLFTERVLRDDDFGHFCQLESLLFPFRTAAVNAARKVRRLHHVTAKKRHT
jgi:hypothetical protein